MRKFPWFALVMAGAITFIAGCRTQNDPLGYTSGIPVPIGDIPGWHQVFYDDFKTDVPVGSFPAAVSDKWSSYPDGWQDTTHNGTYSPSKVVSIHDGAMDVFVHTEAGVHMVAANLPKIAGAVGPEGGLMYGRYSICFRAEAVNGYKTAWLLWPDSEVWPRDGEIDFPEADLDKVIWGFMHRMNGTSPTDADGYSSGVTFSNWHVATIEWSENNLTFIMDGKVIGQSTSRVPSTPMHWVIQTETSTDGETPADAAAGHVYIDWVSVYKSVQ